MRTPNRKPKTSLWIEAVALTLALTTLIVGCELADPTHPSFDDEVARIRAIALAGDDDEPTIAGGDDDMPGAACSNSGVPACKYLGSDVWKCYDVCGNMFYQVTDVGICVDGATLALYNCTGFAR